MKILFVNGSRGEWGYIRPIIELCKLQSIDYTICATNMLLLPSHGSLLDQIRSQGYNISDSIYMSLEGHNHFSMAKSLGVFMTSFVDTIVREKPTWILSAGDRGEQLMATICASYTYTPLAHIQAGERSGNIDGLARHAIGRFAHLHFAANADASKRLIKTGEEEFRVHNVGAPQIDEMVKEVIPDIKLTKKKLSIPESKKYLLCIYHPVTEEMDKSYENMSNLVKVLNEIDLLKIWILPNNDAGSFKTRNALMEQRNNDSIIFDNLDRIDYLSLLKFCEGIIGNSSSAILEAPTFKKGSLNIGRRQLDRVQGLNVVNCETDVSSIRKGVRKLMSTEFKQSLTKVTNPYGDGNSSERILDILKSTPIDSKLMIKRISY